MKKSICLIIAIASAFLSTSSLANQFIVHCDGCSVYQTKNFAKSSLRNGDSLLVFNKQTNALKKYKVLSESNDDGSMHDEPGEAPTSKLVVIEKNLSRSEATLKSAIIRLKETIIYENSASKSFHVNLDSVDAEHAVIDTQAHISSVIRELEASSRWNKIVHELNAYQSELRNNNTITVGTTISSLSFSRSPVNKIFEIIVTHNSGGQVVYQLDTSKSLASIRQLFILTKVLDAGGNVIPQNKSELTAYLDQTYYGDDVDVELIADLFESFDHVSVEEVCSQKDSRVSCFMQGRVIDDKKVHYVLRCQLFKASVCY